MFVTLSTNLTMNVLLLELHYMMLLNKMFYVDYDELGWDPGWLDWDVK